MELKKDKCNIDGVGVSSYLPPEDIWGWWECPKCGSRHEDPMSVYETTCKNNHNVILTYNENGGYRDSEISFENIN
jgi:hypothetical protein